MYTPLAYRQLLEIAKSEGYRFAGYQEAHSPEKTEKVIYLRHDIDYSPVWATSFAKLNAQAGVKATFFFLLRSPTYNFFAYPTLAAVREIASLGQEVGLHFTIEDSSNMVDEKLVARISADFANARSQFPSLSSVFSWHNPSLVPEIMERGLDMVVPGLTNAYSRYFVREVKYYSDSNLRHSVQALQEILRGGRPRLQLLFHPFQWMAQGRDMQEILAKTLAQVIREKEIEFLNNHVYRDLFPSGIPDEWRNDLANRVSAHRTPSR